MKHPWSITLSPFHQLCHQWERRGERDETNCLSIDKTIAVPVFPLMASSYNMRLSATNSQRNARNIVQTNNIVQEAISNIPFSACFFSLFSVIVRCCVRSYLNSVIVRCCVRSYLAIFGVSRGCVGPGVVSEVIWTPSSPGVVSEVIWTPSSSSVVSEVIWKNGYNDTKHSH